MSAKDHPNNPEAFRCVPALAPSVCRSKSHQPGAQTDSALPTGTATIEHRGRKVLGKPYQTVTAYRRDGVLSVALQRTVKTDWVKNVFGRGRSRHFATALFTSSLWIVPAGSGRRLCRGWRAAAARRIGVFIRSDIALSLRPRPTSGRFARASIGCRVGVGDEGPSRPGCAHAVLAIVVAST